MSEAICNDCERRKDYSVELTYTFCTCGCRVLSQLVVNGRKIKIRPKKSKIKIEYPLLEGIENDKSIRSI